VGKQVKIRNKKTGAIVRGVEELVDILNGYKWRLENRDGSDVYFRSSAWKLFVEEKWENVTKTCEVKNNSIFHRGTNIHTAQWIGEGCYRIRKLDYGVFIVERKKL